MLLFSLIVYPMYVGGDLSAYQKVYLVLSDLDILDGFDYYNANLSSEEYIHFVISWVGSRFIAKDVLFSFCNAYLAFVTMSLLNTWRVSIWVGILILLTNFYFLVLYIPAERLKFGFLFLILSVKYRDKIWKAAPFAILAILAHAQIAIVMASVLLHAGGRSVFKLWRRGDFMALMQWVLVLIPLAVISVSLVEEHLISKFQTYYQMRGLEEVFRIVLFALLSIFYSQERAEAVVLFVPMIVAALLLGGDRINMLGYFLFLFFALRVRGGVNAGVLITSAYFAYKSFDFLEQIYIYGEAFVY